jgi:hypothetical protein
VLTLALPYCWEQQLGLGDREEWGSKWDKRTGGSSEGLLKVLQGEPVARGMPAQR